MNAYIFHIKLLMLKSKIKMHLDLKQLTLLLITGMEEDRRLKKEYNFTKMKIVRLHPKNIKKQINLKNIE